MSSDFGVIEQVQREKDIEKLRSLFIKTLSEHESQMVEMNEAHSVQVDLLQQQLSDSNAAVNALKEKVHKIKEMNETDLDLVRVNERRLEGLLKTTLEQNAELRDKLQNSTSTQSVKVTQDVLILQEKNASLVEELAHTKQMNSELLESLVSIRKAVAQLRKENKQVRQQTVEFIASTNQSLGIAKKTADQSLDLASHYQRQLANVHSGLATLKQQLQELKKYAPTIIPINFRLYRVKLQRKINEVFSGQMSLQKENFEMREQEKNENTLTIAGRAMDMATTMKLMIVGAGAAFNLFKRDWEKQLAEIRKACSHFVSVFQIKLDTQKQKMNKKLKSKDIEIRKLNEEIQLLQKSSSIAREKIRALSSPKKKQRSQMRLSATIQKSMSSKTSNGDPSSDIKEPERVSVGTQSGLINMKLIRDRTIRHSKEAELSVVQGELQRAKEKNQKLIEQIAGLRKMVKRAGESAGEESGRARQAIGDLETQLREEKRSVQRKTMQYQRLQRDNEQLALAAAKVEPLKKCLVLLFKSCNDRLEPLMAEQAIPDDLSELDELAQEIFKVPITKICKPVFSRGFLKKQERRLVNAISDSIEVEEVTKVFDSIMDELQRRSKDIKPDDKTM